MAFSGGYAPQQDEQSIETVVAATVVAGLCQLDRQHGPSAMHCAECKPPVNLCAECDKTRHAGKGPLSRHRRTQTVHEECEGADDCPHPAVVECREFCGKLCDKCDRDRHSQLQFADHPPREPLQVCGDEFSCCGMQMCLRLRLRVCLSASASGVSAFSSV